MTTFFLGASPMERIIVFPQLWQVVATSQYRLHGNSPLVVSAWKGGGKWALMSTRQHCPGVTGVSVTARMDKGMLVINLLAADTHQPRG
jgi:hypothetical protein